MIIGLSGTFASGKDTLAKHLMQSKNFMHVSTGDMVRAVAEAEYGNTERPTLLKTANELRRKRGPGVLADLGIEKYVAEGSGFNGLVISGVRTLGEATAIQTNGGIIVFVDAPMDLRYKRIQDRKRANEESLSLEDFKKSEEEETRTDHSDPYVQDLAGVRELADIIVTNDNNLEMFFADAEQKLGLG